MKHSAKPNEPLHDPILAGIYRTRDAYAREFNFDVDAICEALERGKTRATGEVAPGKKQTAKPKSRLAGTRRRIVASRCALRTPQ